MNDFSKKDLVKYFDDERKTLPVTLKKNELCKLIKEYETLIIIGETGSGKTTQIPQFVYEQVLGTNEDVVVTQPRRVAAISLAERVSFEVNTEIGDLVGYRVRFIDKTNQFTKIKFMTDGMLLRTAILEKSLSSYGCIILDEAHERTVNTDLLFGIVKKVQANRKNSQNPLKVIVMSATMNADLFADYFGNAQIVYLQGRLHDIKIFHTKKNVEDYFHDTFVTIFQLHKEAPERHDFLVFLTGQEEIENMALAIEHINQDPALRSYPVIKVRTLYASLPTHEQLKVFMPLEANEFARKIILSTNIAETSVTLTGIKYVIDCGKVKVRCFHPETSMDALKIESISQAQAEQRAGRAGRESDGYCYRIFSKQQYDAMFKDPVPEIQRCNLGTVVLQILAMNIDPYKFDFINKPSNDAINQAYKMLENLGATKNQCLTEVGLKMTKFPLDPRYSKIILSSVSYGCLEDIVNIVSILSTDSIFVSSLSEKKKKQAEDAHMKFKSSISDHIMLLKTFRSYRKIRKDIRASWCDDNFINYRNLEYAERAREQLLDICRNLHLPLGLSCGDNFDPIRKCLLTGFFENIAYITQDKKYVTLNAKKECKIHPTSTLFHSYPHCILYTEIIETSQPYMRYVTVVDKEWLQDIVPNFHQRHNYQILMNNEV
ncbi:ATP-dependent RNA helicase DHX33 [Daktulosphaira vitifoliae]|uniref:ATP-dependent RNA helicase DHX33 n=1 Tax=Daktulosphaira vitifoliae TaxID=58002 RepID=UPI0021A97EE7|nr:ATP-dependent RNA helicase DHX33 [Daktulosphaira vitifoliae]